MYSVLPVVYYIFLLICVFMKTLEQRVKYLESLVYNENDKNSVIVKLNNKWRIKGKKTRYWDAEYNTKKDAEAALRAYWANKNEAKCYNRRKTLKLKIEGFTSDIGKRLIRNVQDFLIKIFGHTLYFDHYTDKSIDLFYKGNEVAELVYDYKTDEVIIIPNDKNITPVAFFDTSEYEIKDYLSDLVLGDVEPEFA